MPYAADGKISKAPIADGIEITDRQYRDALAGIIAGKVVTIQNGELVISDKPSRPEPDEWEQGEREPFKREAPVIADIPAYVPPTIDQERDRRIAKGFKFEGSLYPATPDAYSRIASWVSQATAALAMGVQANDLRWHGGDQDFTWTDMNGIPVPLDAQQMIALGRAANAHRMRLDKKADALRADPPDDVTDDSHWI